MRAEKRDIILSYIVTIQLIIQTIQLTLPLVGIMSVEAAAEFRVIITLLTFIPGIIVVLLNKPKKIILPFVAYFSFLIFQYLLFPASHRYIESTAAYSLTPISILVIIFLVSLEDKQVFSKTLLKISRLSPIFALIYVVAFEFSPFRNLEVGYDMSFGYAMLLPAMILFMQGELRDMVFSFLLAICIILCGSRGPAVVLGLFYIIDLFYLSGKHKGKVILFFIVAALLFTILPRFVDLGSSRTFTLFHEGELISHDSGREENLYTIVVPYILESPLFGWGIGSDRYLLDGAYCHNVFYEITLHYGLIIGSILFIIFGVWVIKLFFSKQLKKDKSERMLLILMLLFGIVPLTVSSSYLINNNFPIMLGYLLLLKRCVYGRRKTMVLQQRTV